MSNIKDLLKIILILLGIIFVLMTLFFADVNTRNKTETKKELTQYLTDITQEKLQLNLDNKKKEFLLKKMEKCFYWEVYVNSSNWIKRKAFHSLEYNIDIGKNEKYDVINNCLSDYKNGAESQIDYVKRSTLENKIRERTGFIDKEKDKI